MQASMAIVARPRYERRMNTPLNPRVAHMLTLPVLTDLLVPCYAQAHNCLEEEIMDDVKRGLADARLQDPLRVAIWNAMKKDRPGVDDAEIVEQLAKAMAKNRRPSGAPDRVIDKMAALFASIDVNVGRAADQTRAMLETTQGKAAVDKAIAEAGVFFASKIAPKKS